MKTVLVEPDFDAWRQAARVALREGYAPEEIDLQDAAAPASLALALEAETVATGTRFAHPHTSKSFLEAAELVAVHREASRWNLLYRLLYRLQTNRDLLKIETDDDVAQVLRFAGQVRRDLHKMHAFVRFRKVLKPGEPHLPDSWPTVVDEPMAQSDPAEREPHHLVLATETPFGVTKAEIEQCDPPPDAEECEQFVAWYQPDHRILPLAAPFFAERFGIMRWTIMTPDATVAWNPGTKQMTFAPGLPRESAPAEDELETLWRSYYASIFNPARVNPAAMRSEMPVRYWKDLPEVSLLPTLITQSKTRVETMVTRQQQQGSAQPFVPADRTVAALREAMPGCKGCELYCHATQVVPGYGDEHSGIMLVGEQPGDQEDRQGLPFVGPAGKTLDRALEELGMDRAGLYLTNAVKHFKFVQRGKLRLHQNPRMSEITACRPWLVAELEAVRPKVVVCLGASASKSLFGGTFSLMKDRGKVLTTQFASQVIATIHPSAILRARDQATGVQLYSFLRDDLALARAAAKA